MAAKTSRSAGIPPWARALGGEIRRKRKLLRLSQAALAELAQCGPDFLYDVENGKPTIRLDKLVSVLAVLGLRLKLERGVADQDPLVIEPPEAP